MNQEEIIEKLTQVERDYSGLLTESERNGQLLTEFRENNETLQRALTFQRVTNTALEQELADLRRQLDERTHERDDNATVATYHRDRVAALLAALQQIGIRLASTLDEDVPTLHQVVRLLREALNSIPKPAALKSDATTEPMQADARTDLENQFEQLYVDLEAQFTRLIELTFHDFPWTKRERRLGQPERIVRTVVRTLTHYLPGNASLVTSIDRVYEIGKRLDRGR